MTSVRNGSLIVAIRALAYFAVLAVVGIAGQSIILDGSTRQLSDILLVVVALAAGQALLAFSPSAWGLVGLALSDLVVTTDLVRASGSSASPFLVLYPVIALGATTVFPLPVAAPLVGAALGAMAFGVGFSLSIVGNGLGILATGVLGAYLAKTLARRDEDLRVSEGARRRLENLQKAILANIPSGLMSVDSEGRIIQVNGVGAKILGRRESDLLHRSLGEVIPAIDEQVTRLNTLLPVAGGLDPSLTRGDRLTVRYQGPDGQRLQLGYSIARLTEPDGNAVLGSLVVFQDLTEIIRMEESLRTSEKLAAVGKLAAGIAHEIRNPLAGISGSAQLLAGLSGLGEEDQRLLQIIQRESTRLDGLITEFFDFVKPPQLKPESVDLVELARQLEESLKVNPKWKALGTELRLVTPTDGATPRAMGDRNKLTQVLLNLTLNSGQAGAKRVELRVDRDASIVVLDDGCGLSAEAQKRLFEPFFTTKDTGTGLGLAVVYKLIESMAGSIEVRSPVPEFASRGGTEVRLRLSPADGPGN